MSSKYPLTTALVLAGGTGERLRPLTDERPKPMVLINGKPLLEYHLHWLRNNGIKRALLLVGYRQEVVREYFAAPRIHGLSVECIGEPYPLGRGGALRHGFQKNTTSDPIFVATNGDIISDQSLSPLHKLHMETDALATLMLTPMRSPYGIVEVDGKGLINNFHEKPILQHWINAGVYILSKSVMERFPETGDHENTLFPILATERRIAGFKSDAYWRSIETLKDLTQCESEVSTRPLFKSMIR